jgi:hypothetical protein
MNKLLVKALLTSTLLVLAVGITASAQLAEGDSIDTEIPFRFYANDTWLPAGKYTLTLPDTSELDVLLLRNTNDSVEVFLTANAAAAPKAYSDEAMLEFDRIGKKDFLSAIWVGGGNSGYQLSEPRLEKKLERAAMKKQKHTVKAIRHKSS